MAPWETRDRIVRLSVSAIVALILATVLAVAFIPPPAHDVRTVGATPLAAALVKSDSSILFQVVQPSESISDIRCELWHKLHDPLSCPGDVASTYFPSITQTPSTLYVPWTGCISWSGSGAIINWQGFNLEYVPSGRRLVIHCYVAEPWITHHETLFGVAALARMSLLVVPTGKIGPGTVSIVEDDRLEHLVGDQSTEFQLATATIS